MQHCMLSILSKGEFSRSAWNSRVATIQRIAVNYACTWLAEVPPSNQSTG